MKKYAIMAIGTIFLVLYFIRIDYNELFTRAVNFPIMYACGIIGLNVINGVIKSIRWRYFLRRYGVNSNLLKDYLSVNSAFFLGLVTPGTAGELSRVMSIGKESRKGISIILFEKLTDFGFLILCVIISVLLQLTGGVKLYFSILCLLIILATVYYLFIRFNEAITSPVKFILSKVLNPGKINNAKDTYEDFCFLLRNPGFLFISSIMSLLLWLLPLTQVYLIYYGVGLNPSIKFVALAYFLPYFFGIISFVPLGIGTFEFSLREVAIYNGGTILSEIVSVTPLFYRIFVTIPLIIFGYACQIILTVIEKKAKGSRSFSTVN